MRPEQKSQLLLGVTRSKAKMLEYGVPTEHHIKIAQDPAKLFTLSIGLLGDLAASINRAEGSPDALSDLRNNLLFSAHFFDSYLQTKLNESLDPYLILLGSASYYLCDLPGSASVLAKRVDSDCPDLDGDGLEGLLLWLIQADLSTYSDGREGQFGNYIEWISKWISIYFNKGIGEHSLIDQANKLRAYVYESGTPRQLLFGDIIAAVIRKKLENSCWKSLPLYSGLHKRIWRQAIQKESFIKELWPAQHLLGHAGVLRGKSAIVQMPTSAGKTKATELVIRSAFLAERTPLAIIIAPFRALCHEIKNSLVAAFHNELTKVDELSDALQTDFEIAELLGHQQILVVTPEKLLYVLRHAPELASYVGLIVFDEGHQFDSGTRGITYELLLTSLNSMLPEGVQKVLISAVISNAKTVGEWLNGGDCNVVEGINLNPTFRSVGFASWLDQLGRIEYVDSRNAEQGEFFVPRVIERFNLGKKGKEANNRFFPEKSDGQAIALYLGLKLAPNGSIAIFCGRKSTAASICEKAVDIMERGISFPLPREFSDQNEVQRLHYLYIENLGAEATASKSALQGIFSHHGNTPHGIRLSVEHAMRENLVRFVVCTSTLAQGVNLPIRYLIVTSVYQGMERIKVRDFHNLIGRAGRAGMHTEGSILFADPIVYDKRRNRDDGWRWEIVKELLDPTKSEECVSSLFQLIPLIIRNDRNKSKDKKNHSLKWDILSFANAYIEGWDSLNVVIGQIVTQHGINGFTVDVLRSQFEFFSMTLSSIEGFLLSNSDVANKGLSEAEVLNLAKKTLAYFLADDQEREKIQELFKLLAQNISESITDHNRRITFGKTLFGVNDARAIEEWVQSNAETLDLATADELLDIVWPLLSDHIHNKAFNKFDKKDVLKTIVKEWISGTPFHGLFRIADQNKCKLGQGERPRKVKIDNIIDICEGGLAYDGALVVSALSQFTETLNQEGTDELIGRLQIFQKQLKYGLPTEASIILYEIGFSDRVIAQDLASELNFSRCQNKHVIRALKKNKDAAFSVMAKYPIYFQQRLSDFYN